MKIVTYNVNGLRQRVSQFGSLSKLLNSFDADIICFQETKLRKQELKSDLVIADGYESFFSCTRTSDKGRSGYSGVATFCRVKSAFNSNEVALPVVAEEGFTGVLEGSGGIAVGLEGFEKDELCRADNEGRCVVTDHGHFVLFNVYGPRAGSDDVDRIEFKLLFYKILQKRWESLLSQGRRILVVGDLNIAPSAIDRCEAGPDFENDQFRRWFRSMLVESGGSFFDVFRAKHPERREAYTCWPSNTGAEQFNYGTRIDHILCAGSCLHEERDLEGHNLLTCHVKDCDILTEYKRWKDGNTPRYRWKGGLNVKLEGSDHAPVYLSLEGVPEIPQHSTPSLASRYLPMICGLQQTLVSMLMKRKVAEQVFTGMSASPSAQTTTVKSCCSNSVQRSFNNCSESEMSLDDFCSPLMQESEGESLKTQEQCRYFANEASCDTKVAFGSRLPINILPGVRTNKKPRKSQSSQLSLKSFFQKSPKLSNDVNSSATSVDEVDVPKSPHDLNKSPEADVPSSGSNLHELHASECSQDRREQDGNCSLDKEKNNVALLEWRRIQQLMENSIPLCKGHQEPCVARVVKKPGPTFGRRFYVCARAEGPASNPEANCNYFKWASSKSRQK